MAGIRLISNLRVAFRTFLVNHPIVGNAIVYGTLCVGAETSQQSLNKKILNDTSEPLDRHTIGRYAIYGTTIAGPLLATWYRFLDKQLPGKTTKIVLKKMVFDQFTFTPLLLVVFYVSMSIMERKQDVFEECRMKFLQTFGANCLFWIPAQAVNFSLVPPVYRVTYIGTCSFAWINVLCWFKRQ
ncbi:mpv17-like protein [Cylas formicarius]|uniref:mpv17-like protein n=1 Tax=Cylas formicarius TaxID=197179 RepID=UPI002958623F|nr:mpv17-like protein [Cylas formicarius]XP_060524159.1 mpv17-like protein [Cylas formicarius]